MGVEQNDKIPTCRFVNRANDSQDGSMSLEIDMDEMFTDHALAVEITHAGEIVVEGL